MREILFKAKRIDNGKWVEGYYCKWLKGERIITYSEKETDCIITWMSNGGMSRYEVDPETLCQFTGLLDKNGNKIWENDIVKYEDDLVNMVKVDLIGWNETHAAFTRLHRSKMGLQYLYIDEFIASNSEVIGNIFDNPELLKGGSE